MYLTLNQVVLISDQSKRRPADAIVYVKETSMGEKRFYPAFVLGAQSPEQLGLTRYGTIYTDATHDENWCIVPDTWNEDDALLAKDWRETNE